LEEIISAGIDIGTSTTQIVFSRIKLENKASAYTVPEINIIEKNIFYEGNIYFTPLISEKIIDGKQIRKIIEKEYKNAGVSKEEVKTGAVIITGETARKENAQLITEEISDLAGDFVVAAAGPDLEAIIAAKGAGSDKVSKEKNAAVDVVYAKSFYGGADNATQKLAGEFIGIIAASSPSEVKSGLNSAVNFIENSACFYSANEDDSICYYNHCISRTGSYLSETAGIKKGNALAYLIAPPTESIYALDAALKAADVRITNFFGPPSETNFGGAMLTGTQSACKAACSTFAYAVKEVADNPKSF